MKLRRNLTLSHTFDLIHKIYLYELIQNRLVVGILYPIPSNPTEHICTTTDH